MLVRIAVALSLVAAVSGCGGGGGAAGDRTVVAAFYPLAWAAERLVGDGTTVVDLTPPGVEPHDLELTARDVERIRGAELVLYLGGFMPALDDAVRGQDNAVDLLEGLELLSGDHDHEDDGGHPDEDAHDEGGTADPHVWLDPIRFAEIVRAMARELGATESPVGLVSELEALDDEYRTGLANCERREIVTSHAAFAYLADAYGLRQIALSGLSPEAEPTPRALEALVRQVGEVGATTVFFEPLVSSRVAETVAREAGVATAALDPLEGLTVDQREASADYLSVMRENLETLRTALGCR